MPIFLHRNSPELKDSHVACFNNRQKVFVHAILKLCIRDASGFKTGYPDFYSLAKSVKHQRQIQILSLSMMNAQLTYNNYNLNFTPYEI